MPKISKRQRMKILGHKSAAKRLSEPSVREENLETAPAEPNNQQTSNLNLLWNTNAQESLRRYSRSMFGYSDRHVRRLKQKNREAAKGCLKIDSMFQPISTSTPNATLLEQIIEKDNLSPKEELKEKAEKAIQRLSQFAVPVVNVKSEQQKLGVAEYSKYEGVYLYLYAIINSDMRKMSASKIASDIVFKSKSTWHRARNIRRYAEECMENGEISLGTQGKHSKRISVLDDEDIKRKVLEWFTLLPKPKRTVAGVRNHLRDVILPERIGDASLVQEVGTEGRKVDQLSEDCIRRKLISWGYGFKRLGKNVYFDGHEREDVVEYRDSRSKRMMGYYRYSEKYDDINPAVVTAPLLPPGTKQHVFVTHDESTFYSNDFQKYAWVGDGESYCLPKSEGRSIMVSEFQCPCHGTMRGVVNGKNLTSRKIFYPGAQYEGYWKSSHMLAQLEDIILLFETLHPGMLAVFLFDQSSNHTAFPEGALIAHRMNMSAIEVTDESSQGKFRDETFYVTKNYDYVEQQKVFFPKQSQQQKTNAYQRIHNKIFKVDLYNVEN